MVNVEESLNNIYKNKKVFITGHTGFKGAWMSLMLHKLGAKLVGYSLAPVENGIFNILNIEKYFEKSIIADINNKQQLETEILNYKPDFIFHLAAQSLVINSYQDPYNTFTTNVIGTLNVLDAIVKLENKCASVIITTDKVYKNTEKEIAFKENDTLGANDPYSTSKACAELVVDTYINTILKFNEMKPIATARAGNVIGGGDWCENRLIPDFYRAIINKKSLIIRNPNSVRPWQFVLDPIYGYLLLGKKLYEGSFIREFSWNFGPNESEKITVNEVINLLNNLCNNENKCNIDIHKSDLKESNFLLLSSEKSISKLDWKPKYTSKEAIKVTAEWYNEFLTKNSIETVTHSQIENYLKC
jgi:CDP-glucose 4,6-dehydratase